MRFDDDDEKWRLEPNVHETFKANLLLSCKHVVHYDWKKPQQENRKLIMEGESSVLKKFNEELAYYR
jgi:hypothetical protein